MILPQYAFNISRSELSKARKKKEKMLSSDPLISEEGV